MATFAKSDQLLVIIDPTARRLDGESVRIAKDVLSAGAAAKVCLPEGPEEFARALDRRGTRRPVVVGGDRALVRTVSLLHRQRELAGCALSVVPVGDTSLAESLGVPGGAVAAARAVLDGAERRLDLLVDDSDGVVLGALGIPPVPVREPGARVPVPSGHPWLRTTYRSLIRTLASRPARLPAVPCPGHARLRVDVDGETVVDLDQPVEKVSVTPAAGGVAEVEVRPLAVGAERTPLLTSGRTVTVAGADFRYRADAAVSGPVRKRTWRVLEGAWGLVLPPA
ncbi:diacylglycerol kinase [Streptomyces pluripotens]|uniref:Diacylglycerol kinase n=1 Tax=Streptomyces pluripotens TaxID=1355015 RepID=A0A221NYX0_9ACTN|nr:MULTISPECIES: diacylglycerol kinase family protein [Streptomyces]ARP70970.1 diacylglycerol kinase [Streptomyces pluripotens]ASN25223.1 diacylglycerol kinase [Streptomyces pluripotens]KIE27668.1 diacylglycerol kinase [Streptomyces sp. MUSC 125]MCH0559757.1 diacylglycerol kinase [Streptomyces sp. MUM 16J]